MKKYFIAFTAIVSVLGFSDNSQASFLVEPFVGSSVSGTIKDNSGSADLTNMSYGLRLGFSTLGFMYGLDYGMDKATAKPTTGDTELDSTNIGAFIGYTFPVMIRAYATYFFSSKADADTTPAVSYDGTGYKIGVGYTGLPFVAINLETVSQTYDTCEVSGFSTCTMTDGDQVVSTTQVSISFPFSL